MYAWETAILEVSVAVAKGKATEDAKEKPVRNGISYMHADLVSPKTVVKECMQVTLTICRTLAVKNTQINVKNWVRGLGQYAWSGDRKIDCQSVKFDRRTCKQRKPNSLRGLDSPGPSELN